jgi:hypothetical protein
MIGFGNGSVWPARSTRRSPNSLDGSAATCNTTSWTAGQLKNSFVTDASIESAIGSIEHDLDDTQLRAVVSPSIPFLNCDRSMVDTVRDSEIIIPSYRYEFVDVELMTGSMMLVIREVGRFSVAQNLPLTQR